MKRISLMAVVILSSVLAVCCSKQSSGPDEPTEESAMRISLDVEGGTFTKAAPDSTLQNIQVFLYNSDSVGMLYKYYSFTAQEVSDRSALLQKVNSGKYVVYVVANAPELEKEPLTTKLKTFERMPLVLDKYNDPDSLGYLMSGKASDVVVTSNTTTPCYLSLKRYVAKVRLISVKSNVMPVYGNITLDCAYLTNVNAVAEIGRNDLSAAAYADTSWYNKEGRYDVKCPLTREHLVTETTAQAGALTFINFYNHPLANGEVKTANKDLYAFRNSASDIPQGFVATLTAPQKTMLVVEATLNGIKYYYPVVLNSIAENTRYDVTLTVNGPGSEDPNQPIQIGAMTVQIAEVTDWTPVAPYEENI